MKYYCDTDPREIYGDESSIHYEKESNNSGSGDCFDYDGPLRREKTQRDLWDSTIGY